MRISFRKISDEALGSPAARRGDQRWLTTTTGEMRGDDLVAEIDALRAEIDRLRAALADEIDRLRAVLAEANDRATHPLDFRARADAAEQKLNAVRELCERHYGEADVARMVLSVLDQDGSIAYGVDKPLPG